MVQSEKSAVPANLSDIREFLPRSATIIEQFSDSAGRTTEQGPVLAAARRLAVHHRRQWWAEDVSRYADASHADVAAAKHLIDELNAVRAALVEELDTWVSTRVRGPAGASLHTETLGSVVDRLAIAWVRASCLSESSGSRERARQALGQLAELADAYDDLVRDLVSGQRRLPAWRVLKTYGRR